jgi:hypothetical protein
MDEKPREEGSILGELKLLGEQLGTAVKALWESEESKHLRQEIAEGITEASRQIDTALKSAQESEAAKEFSTQVRGAVDKARETDVAEKIGEGLATGLHELNAQLNKLLSSWEVRKAAEPETPPPAADMETGTTPHPPDTEA